ncbi:hypothetical protein SLEP1_g9530 [Rubroshorea leprosula]|uniref:Reverse transcriptase domain-containing protein n=1 Tax=Rubroshorea leprosula TaxID=152421 RepID=A0AAV5IB77_9ROSI|nr:hypothetical protein SLEP1_g9530 [Rubroshorea leprosula]
MNEKGEKRNKQVLETRTQYRSYAEVVSDQGKNRVYEERKFQSNEDQSRGRGRSRSRSRPRNRSKGNRKIWQQIGKREDWSGIEYKEKFYMEGYFSCRIRAMGGKLVLLDCEDKEELKDLVELEANWLEQWFEEVRPWTPDMVSKERFVWMRCQEVPLNAWEPDFFAAMGCAWGNFICLDDSTSKRKRFDIARFLISTPIMNTISVMRQVKVNGIIYNIKFTKEEFTNNFFSLKQDFMPTFQSESEEHESLSMDSDIKEQEFKNPGDVGKVEMRSPVTEVEDDDVASFTQETKKRLRSQAEEKEEKSVEVVVSRSGNTKSNANEEDYRNRGSASENDEREEEDPFWKGFESEEGRLKEWMGRKNEGIPKKKNRRIRSCKAVYLSARAIGEDAQRRKGRGKKRKQKTRGKTTLEDTLCSNEEVASGSVGDGGIHNCNRIWKGQVRQHIAQEIWDFAKQLGVVAENEEQQWGLRRTVSDHYPIILKNEMVDWGPKPFKFFDAWLEQPRCKEVIKKAWNSSDEEGWKGYRFKEKLKRTKNALKEWNGNSTTKVDSKINEAEKEIALLDNKDEIKEAVWDYDSSKSPGPDGFNFRFVKAMWEDIKADVVGFVQEFHRNGKLVYGSNASFIVLIPKVDNPQKIEEYRPISLIGVMYKIIAKLLANRLRKVLPKIIGEQQMAFIGGRQLVEGAVVANEIIDEAKRKKMKSFLFKVDFEKAYDKVCWEFIDYMLMRMGFSITWRKWIQECLRSKGLNGLVSSAVVKEQYKGVIVGNEAVSLMGIGVGEEWRARMAFRLYCKEGGFPFKYLGIPIGGNHRRITMWQPMVESFKRKLEGWKGRHLSFGGRITLINSVLSSLPIFLMLVYLIPKGTEKKCNQMGNTEDEMWKWDLAWRKILFEWEADSAEELNVMITDTRISPGSPDKWLWTHNNDGKYSTKSTYSMLIKDHDGLNGASTFKRVWNPILPNKIAAFNWQVLFNRIPTKLNLLKRGCAKGWEDNKCVMCEAVEEDSDHLFLKCRLVKWLWKAYAAW